MTFEQFTKRWNGKKADYDGQYGGECVDLYNYYMADVFGLNPYEHGAVGGAYELANNLPKYKEIKWTSTKKTPPKGSIVVFDRPIGGGFGHVGMSDNGLRRMFDQIGAIDPSKEQPSGFRNHEGLRPYQLGYATLKGKDDDMVGGRTAKEWRQLYWNVNKKYKKLLEENKDLKAKVTWRGKLINRARKALGWKDK